MSVRGTLARRATLGAGLAVTLAAAWLWPATVQHASASGETRTLSMFNIHTKEAITVTFKKDGRYDQDALKRLNLPDPDSLMEAIARQQLSDAAVMEALMPGSGGSLGSEGGRKAPAQREAISIKGLTPGVAFTLAACHPVPGDRIVGLRRPGEPVEVHTIDCPKLADGIDADWVDLAWGDGSDGGTARLSVVIKNEPGSLGIMSGILGSHGVNIVNLALVHRDSSFHTFHIAIEVRDVQHLMRILAALRAVDAVSQAERL